MRGWLETLLGMVMLAALRDSRPAEYFRLWGYTVWSCEWPDGLWTGEARGVGAGNDEVE